MGMNTIGATNVSVGGQVEACAIVRQAKLAIGGLTVELKPGPGVDGLVIYPYLVPFLVSSGRADTVLTAHCQPIPTLQWGEKVFDSGPWRLYRRKETFTVTMVSPRTGPLPYRLAVFNSNFTRGDLYIPPTDVGVRRDVAELGPGSLAADPLLPPIDEVLMVNLLSQERGVYIHACGVAKGGKALIFCGVSGAGKSTMANLWKRRDVVVLSDDRLIVRKEGSRFWVYGTPWHGDAKVASPTKAEVEGIYFLKHGPQNRIAHLSPFEATTKLMVCCFPTFHDRGGMEFILALLGELATAVPCSEFSFVPDESAVEAVGGNFLD